MKRILLLTYSFFLPASLASAQDNACLESTIIDPCVVGSWVLESGGPVAWMEGLCGMINDATQGKLEGRGGIGAARVTYYEDGSYEASANGFRMMILNNSFSARGRDLDTVNLQGTTQPATGRWSVSGETLNNCQDGGGMSGTVYTSDVDHRLTTNVPGMGDISMGYACSATTLETSMSMGFYSDEIRSGICSLYFPAYRDPDDIRDPGDDFPMKMKFVRAD